MEQPSSAPSVFARSVDLFNRIDSNGAVEGYLKMHDQWDWRMVCNAGLAEFMKKLACKEMGYGQTYAVSMERQEYNWHRWATRRILNIVDWSWDKRSKDEDTKQWYRISSCSGSETSLSQCSFSPQTSCSEGVFVLGCKSFSPKEGCNNYVGNFQIDDERKHPVEGFVVEGGVIFNYVKDSPYIGASYHALVYTDMSGNPVRTGVMPKGSVDTDDWKDVSKWETGYDGFRILDVHRQCGGVLPFNTLQDHWLLNLHNIMSLLAVVGVLSMAYFSSKWLCAKSNNGFIRIG